MVGGAALPGLTAEHAHLVVEAHLEGALLVAVAAHQAHIGAAPHHLAHTLHADPGVVLGLALQVSDVLWAAANFLSTADDVAVGFQVSSLGPGGWEVHVEPLGPRALWLAGGGPR